MESYKLFQRLSTISQRNLKISESLAYELTVVPNSLFKPTTQLMRKAEKNTKISEKNTKI